MTNREDEILATTTATTTAEPMTNGHDGVSDFERDELHHTKIDIDLATSANHNNSEWTENPPSSASSGFSDDDSLAGLYIHLIIIPLLCFTNVCYILQNSATPKR
jgi:hypothetical protein